MREYGPDIGQFRLEEVCRRIQKLTSAMMRFWKDAHGWAPFEAAGLLSNSMLDWQKSLASCLDLWLSASTHGELILAWANLGSLVEGQLKLFLSVWYNNYKSDAEAVKKKGKLQDPDSLMLEPLRQFFVKRIWAKGKDWNPWVKHVQEKRNAIHAFQARDIGTFEMWREDVRNYLAFLRDMNSRLPYPDEVYIPREN